MQLTPRYDGPAVIRVEHPFDRPAVPLLRQRERFAKSLETFDEKQWASPTRCEEWNAQDVVTHLISTNQFWAFSIASGLAGSPSTMLATFDPVATPELLVDAERAKPPEEILQQFKDSNAALADAVAALDANTWTTIAEAPPGHIPINALALHALWDCWTHERDVMLPLGIDVPEEPDEIISSLAYAAGLGPAFSATGGSSRTGTLVVEVTNPDVRIVVDIGPSVVVHGGASPDDCGYLRGDALELLEALSFRLPLAAEIADDDRWMLSGLDVVFDLA